MLRVAMVVLLSAGALVSGCGGGAATFALTRASVDPTFTCPVGAADAPYVIHATVEANNPTANTVTIRSASATMTLSSIKGTWLEPVGDEYHAAGVSFSPSSVAAGASSAVSVSIPSSCSNGKPGAHGSSYGDYSVAVELDTSAGKYKITSKNQHRIVAA